MKSVILSDVCSISSGGTPSRANPEYFRGHIPWVKISDIENAENGVVYNTEESISEEGLRNIRGKTFQKGTLLFAMYGSIGKTAIAGKELSTNQAILGIKPKIDGEISIRYLKAWFESNKQTLINQGRGVALKNLSATIVRNLEIKLPPLDDQTRIAHLLGKVEGLIAQRKQHLQELDDLLKSVFLEMFGDPVRNERGWETQPFSKIGKFTSGGTPSKSRGDFWAGEFPWVSPKDMKVPKIFDSEDHVSVKVFDETSLKRIAPGHLLIVVRGMILARSFPVAINMVDVAINQDMKAIRVNSDLRTAYVFHCLNALKRQILKLITTAGHGTKKFDSNVMAKLLIPVPAPEMQDRFLLIADKIEGAKSRYQQSLSDLEALYGALSQQAFKGELDLSRVPLPAQSIAPASIGDQAIVPEPVVQVVPVINLPACNKLPAALENAEARKALIEEWLQAYRGQLGSTPFSVQDFIAAAQARLAELHPDSDLELGASDYEYIKDWVFEALAAGTLTQGFDNAGNRIELKTVPA